MESKCVATGVDPLHICDRWQLDGFGWKKDHECNSHSSRLALGDHLYIDRYYSLAHDGIIS